MRPLQLISIFLLFSPIFSAAQFAKPGCLNTCGNLPIPYPFGVGSNCSLNPYFNIDCNTSTDPPKAYLSFINKQVIEINQTYIRLINPYMISACYDLSANDGHSLSLNLSGTPYTLSFGNVLTAIGCDDMVLRSNGSSVSGGCSAFCADKNGTGGVGNCPFHGCCQERLDKANWHGTSVMEAQLIDLSGKSQREKLFPCSYAFMQELDETTIFSYPLYYLHNSTALVNDNWASATRRPVVRLDWIVGTENCSRARNSATYACGDDKSVCVDDDSNRGYMCNCVQGYEGNPYLHGGCQTISFSRSSIAKSGCLGQCGQVSIPYPFGVGPNCCLEPSFEILCNTSTNPPKAYLAIFNTEIVELNSTKVLVNYLNLASTCYNNENGITKAEERRLTLDLMRSQYRLSEENWITAVGCDDTAVAVIGQTNLTSIRTACAAICSDAWIYDNAQCDYGTTSLGGEACCRVPIPRVFALVFLYSLRFSSSVRIVRFLVHDD